MTLFIFPFCQFGKEADEQEFQAIEDQGDVRRLFGQGEQERDCNLLSRNVFGEPRFKKVA